MSRIKRLLAVLFCLLLTTTCVFAGEIDPEETCSLTVRCKHKAEDVTYAIWRVAAVDEDVHFTLTSQFKASKVKPNNTEDWAEIAETLAGYAESREIKARATDDTNRNGEAYFDELPTGLYLVIGESYTYNGKTYEQDPFLIALPTRSDNTEPWEYDVVTIRKSAERVEEPDEPEKPTVDVEVLKIWSGEDETAVRPDYITVHLLRDGTIYDTVTLNRGNNWEYEWKDLPADHTWRVTEAVVPEGYSVIVRRDGYDFVIVNTYEPPEEPSVIPDVPDVPDHPAPDKPEELPKTGTMQWLVPLLLGAGILLFVLGLIRRRQED